MTCKDCINFNECLSKDGATRYYSTNVAYDNVENGANTSKINYTILNFRVILVIRRIILVILLNHIHLQK